MHKTFTHVLIAITALLFGSAVIAETLMITGANKGIGFEFTKQYLDKGWHVIATHRRDSAPESLANLAQQYDQLQIESMDITDIDSVKTLAAKLNGQAIDVLINNAGYGGDITGAPQRLGTLAYENFDTIMRTNGLGAIMVSEAFREHVATSDRKVIAAMSSTLASFEGGAPTGGSYWYRMSKAALHMSMLTLSKDLKKDAVTVVALNPGIVWSQKNLDRGLPEAMMIKVEPSVSGLIEQIENLSPEDSGKFIAYNGKRLPW